MHRLTDDRTSADRVEPSIFRCRIYADIDDSASEVCRSDQTLREKNSSQAKQEEGSAEILISTWPDVVVTSLHSVPGSTQAQALPS